MHVLPLTSRPRIEFTEFVIKNEKGKIVDYAAHFYCSNCNMNYSSTDVGEVWRKADVHAIACQ